MEGNIDLMEHLMRLMRTVRRHPGRQHMAHGSFRVLRAVLAQPGLRASDLADELGIRPSSLTEVLNRMEQVGDIRRQKDETDSRVSHICATEKGRAIFEESQAARGEQRRLLNACLTDEETAVFCALCDKLSDYLDTQLPAEERHSQ